MNFQKIDHWKTKEDSNGLIFFVQRMAELLFDYTLDTYKPMALNAPFLCIEALSNINDIEEGLVDKNNLTYILEELRWSIQNDKIAKRLINSTIDYYLEYTEDTTLSTLKLRLEILERSLDRYRYIDETESELTKAILSNSKDDIDVLSKTYVTTFINWGISKTFLYTKLNDTFFDTSKPILNNEILKSFFKDIYPMQHNFSIYFRVTNNIRLLNNSFDFFNIKILDALPNFEDKKFNPARFIIRDNYVVIEIINIKSTDPYKARDIAANRLETLKNVSQIFLHNSKLKWNDEALILQNCCNKNCFLAKKKINSMKKTRNHKASEIEHKVNHIFKNVALKGESFTKFNRAIQLHSNSLHDINSENQLVNLWTAFETIVPSKLSNKSKVILIINSIYPILLKEYSKRIIQNLYDNFCLWDKDYFLDMLKKIDNTKNDFENFFNFLILPENDSFRKEVYNKLHNYHLLRNRTYKVSEIFKDKEKLVEILEKHEKKLKWQIRRIYRTRNLIVHAGRTPLYLDVLIENAHDYLDQVLSQIILLTTSNYRIKTLDQAYELSKLEWLDMHANIKKNDKLENLYNVLINN